MDYLDLLSKASSFYDKLEDDFSRKIFNARLKFFFNRDFIELDNDLLSITDNWILPEVDAVINKLKNIENIIIFGAGKTGQYNYRLLKRSKYKNTNIFFTDNNQTLWDKSINIQDDNENSYSSECRVHCISPMDLKRYKENSVVIIGSINSRWEIINQLLFLSYPFDRVVIPIIDFLRGQFGWQYFDMFTPSDNEVFLDAGCLDGYTCLDFIKWCNNKFDYIYAFEPDPIKTDDCKLLLNKYIDKISFYDVGLWNKKDRLCFESAYHGGTHVSEQGNTVINVDSIDNVLNGNRVSFIKMDIEGSEYNALCGAEKLIKKYRPRLAISLYHKPEDIFIIPQCISSIDPTYKFSIRHYFSDWRETVLYAY